MAGRRPPPPKFSHFTPPDRGMARPIVYAEDEAFVRSVAQASRLTSRLPDATVAAQRTLSDPLSMWARASRPERFAIGVAVALLALEAMLCTFIYAPEALGGKAVFFPGADNGASRLWLG